MKQPAIIAVCILLGFFLGRWTPTTDLHRLRQELKELRAGRNRSGDAAQSASAAAQGFLRIDPTKTRSTPATDNAPAVDEDDGDVTPTDGPAQTETVVSAEAAPQPENMEQVVERAKEMWTVRADLARNSFLENLDAHDEERVRFDVLIEAMNIRLATSVEAWVADVKERGQVRPEDGARLMHELSGAVVLTYDEMDRGLREEWRDTTKPEFALFDFIDPDVIEPLTELDELENGFRPHRRRHRPE